MRQVLFVIHYPVFGGPHNQALRLAAPMAARGWEQIVLLPDEPGNAAQRLRAADIEVIAAPLLRLRAVPDLRTHVAYAAGYGRDVARIRSLIRERDIDVVVIGGLVNGQAAVAARAEGIPVVWQILDTRAPWLLRRALMVQVARQADVVMSTGSRVAAAHPGTAALGARLVQFFPPVDTDAFRPDPAVRAAARNELGFSENDLVVGNVSNLNPMKGHRTFVRAAAAVRRTHPDVRFAVLGASYGYRDDYVESLWREMRVLGLRLGEDLIVRDPGARVAALLPAFDVFWMTSEARSEGIPTVVGEAMACALPIVAADAGGTAEAVAASETGYLAPPGNSEEFARLTLPLLDDPNLRTRMGAAGRKRSIALFAVDVSMTAHETAFERAIACHTTGSACAARPGSKDLERMLCCPVCHGDLTWDKTELRCTACAAAYLLDDGIPLLLPPSSGPGDAYKAQQASFFDRADPEWEIVRPQGSPALYQWLLDEKFRRSIAALRPLVVRATAVTVCGGSGMDAEYLARAGARVIATDLSIEAARRTRERARRHDLAITPVVADVEALPFRDHSIDLVYVHDGLHHLENPLNGLREMARVAGGAISVNEPARAAVTRLAVRTGAALEIEEAGNRVERIEPERLAAELRSLGFHILRAERYGMYYRHEPGSIVRTLSRGPLLLISRYAVTTFNRFAGRIGNKSTIQAIRD